MSDGQPRQGARLVRQRVGLLATAWSTSSRTSAPKVAKQQEVNDRAESTGSRRSRTSATSTASGSWSAPTSTCRCTTARSPTTSGSAPRCRRSSGSSSTAPPWSPPRHLGRPKGEPDPKYSMDPVRARLAELAPGVELLENLRFDPGEEGNDPAFVAPLDRRHRRLRQRRVRCSASGSRLDRRPAGDAAVGDGSAARRREVEVLLGLRNSPKRPFVAVLGGAKISDKLGVVEALLDVGRRARHRRSDVLHVPRRPGPLDR